MSTEKKLYCVAITITFRRALENVMNPRQQLLFTLPLVGSILEKSCDFVIVPELTQCGRIHYHGELVIKHKTVFTRNTIPQLRKLCGHILHEFMNDVPGWERYMLKDTVGNLNVFDIQNLLFNENNYQLHFKELTNYFLPISY